MLCAYALEAHETIVGEGGLRHYIADMLNDFQFWLEKKITHFTDPGTVYACSRNDVFPPAIMFLI